MVQNAAPEKQVTYTLFLPWPPTVNHYWEHVTRRTKGGKVYIGKKLGAAGVAFRTAVVEAVRKGHRAPPRLKGRLSLAILANPPDNRIRDLDNVLKAMDALIHAGVIEDDALFDELYIRRGQRKPGGGLRVSIRPMGNANGL